MPTIGGDLRQTAPSAAAVAVVDVPTIADRDRVATNGTVRLNGIVFVAADGNHYRVTDTAAPAFDNLGPSLGSSTVVADIATRDALSPSTGDRVRVLSVPFVYEWTGTAWLVVGRVLSPSLRLIEVNHATGDDVEGVGTAGDPVATIQEAVNRFKSPSFGVQQWAPGDDRVIHVQAPGGDNKIQESVVIPPHAGQGALIIEGEETDHYTGLTVDTPAFTNLVASGFEVRQRLNLVGTPLTPSDPNIEDASFWVIDSPLSANPWEAEWENHPVVLNAAGSVDAVALDPGVLSAFGTGPGSTGKIASPTIIWQPGPVDTFAFLQPTTILNQGGALVVRGFRAQPRDDQALVTGGTFLVNAGAAGDGDLGATCQASRIIIEANGAGGVLGRGFSGDNIALVCAILSDNGFGNAVGRLFEGVRQLTIQGLRMKGAGVWVSVDDFTTYGLDHEGSFLEIDGPGRGPAFYADIRGRLILAEKANLGLVAFSCEGAGQAAITVVDQSALFVPNSSRIRGTTGNTRGVQLNEFALMTGVGTMANVTLSGSSGNVKVGNLADSAWATKPRTDGTDFLARYR